MGYNTVELKPGYNMFSLNFKNVGASEGKYDIQNLFLGGGNEKTPFTSDMNAANADQIKVFSNDGEGHESYTTYYLYNTTKTKTDLVAKKFYWVNQSGGAIADNVPFKNGDAVWFLSRNPNPTNFTVSGEVDLKPVENITIINGYNMIGNFFPTGWALNDEQYTPEFWQGSGAKADMNAANADQIKVFYNDGKGGESYTTYYLYDTTKTKTDLVAKKFQWVNQSGGAIVSNDVLKAANGAWYIHRGTGMTLEMKNKIK